ncbi:hypothetical protein BDY19DRAFT_927205 [Irpex rosettiformis]|uniref:Uncharacterized protein n=1 Tax=Irpex rosettiformis TaxID=378272 RepID=A0ACB8UC55_9APHY|nr:hypothetical protein BDY19DRAFT_927205 [Irpex rosettiformis]
MEMCSTLTSTEQPCMDTPISHWPQKFCITNMSHTTKVLTGIDASPRGGHSPILAANNVDDEAQFWEYDPSLHTIKNVKTGPYAIPEDLHKGARILESVDPFSWNVDEQSSGQFAITLPEDSGLLWTLCSDKNYGFVRPRHFALTSGCLFTRTCRLRLPYSHAPQTTMHAGGHGPSSKPESRALNAGLEHADTPFSYVLSSCSDHCQCIPNIHDTCAVALSPK